MQRTAPVIGFTLDYEITQTYSKLPWYAIRENYLTAVSDLGAIPLPLPHLPALAEEYLARIDALVVTGGAFDVPAGYVRRQQRASDRFAKAQRTAFENAITRACLKANKPILGICGGEQLLNVILGGTLIQHIPDSIPNAVELSRKIPRTEPGHTVRIEKNTLLHRITGQDEIPVNSAHHQAVAKVGKGVIINAVASDGVIEGIEYPAHPFCLVSSGI